MPCSTMNCRAWGGKVAHTWSALSRLADQASGDKVELLGDPTIVKAVRERLEEHCRRSSGSASRVTRLLFIDTPLSFDLGEVTDKGSVNQRAVLRNRADLVERLWSDDPRIIAVESRQSEVSTSQ